MDELAFSLRFPALMTALVDRGFLGIAVVDLGEEDARRRESVLLLDRSTAAVAELELTTRDA